MFVFDFLFNFGFLIIVAVISVTAMQLPSAESFGSSSFFVGPDLTVEPRKVLMKGRILWQSPHELADDFSSMQKCAQCVVTCPLSQFD
jgi:hypothetical protein